MPAASNAQIRRQMLLRLYAADMPDDRFRERAIRTAEGRKVVVSGRKGFDRSALAAALKEALAVVEAEIEAGQGGGTDADRASPAA